MTATTTPKDQRSWTLNILGGFRLLRGSRDHPLSASSEKLVAFLALGPKRSTRSCIADNLWSDGTQERAAGNLRSTLWRLRREAGNIVQTSVRSLALSSAVSLDSMALETLAGHLLETDTPAVCCSSTNIHLLGQELLPGWYDEWTLFERERLRQLSLQALERITDLCQDRRLFMTAVQAALTAVHLDPLRESATRRLIQAHLALGNSSDAIHTYSVFERRLDRRLGIAPNQTFVEMASHQPWVSS